LKNHLNILKINHSFESKCILNAVSLDIFTGDIVGLFGRNGAGKSTLLKILFGSFSPNEFSMEFNQSIVNHKDLIPKQIIGYLPQQSFLPKAKKVREIIPMFFENTERQDKVFYTPKINFLERKKIANLSMGELRYLEFILLINLDHPFLLLDEPFSNIEPLYKDALKEQILSFQKNKGFLISDHCYEDVLQISNKNFLLSNARLIQINNINDLKVHNYLK